MAGTPPRIHWDSFLHSPSLEGSTESYISTSSLEYVNAQLVAHGFASPPGLSLDGLSGTDADRLVKCLLCMLSQRLQDMSRTEELSAKFRTLTYDHERLLTMHRTANEKVATAEKEVNLYKTKLTAAQRTLESSESSHKQTTAELQRTRAALQGIRTTHQQELKKKDKELERMASKWSKLSDAQIKLSTVPSGLKCANVGIVHGSELIPRTPSLLDIALDDAEKAREQLIEEVGRLRRLVVKVVNQIQAVLFHVRGFVTDKNEQPIEHNIPTLFPMYPPTHAHDVLSATLRSLRDALAALPLHIASAPIQSISSSSTNTSTRTPESADPKTEEVARLHATIAQLKQEIDQAHTQAQHQASQTRALFDNFAVPQQETPSDVAETSMELMTTSMADAERERLEKIRQELDNEKEKFTQAAVQLGRERTALEADRVRLLEEKRSWEVQQMLDDLPPTPDPHPQFHPPQAPDIQQMPRRTPRKPKVTIHHSFTQKSPRKLRSRKRQSSTGLSSAGRKAKRSSHRPSATSVESTSTASEIEVIAAVDEAPPHTQYHPSIFPPPPPLAVPSFSLKPSTSTTSILHSPFVLPPPSPEASLPRQPLFPPSSSVQFQSMRQPDFLMTHLPPPTPFNESTPFPEGTVTPVKRPFPNKAKPFPQRVIHAYSPVKPSPLSRILMLNHSPDIPSSEQEGPLLITGTRQLDVVHEEENEIDNAYSEGELLAIQPPQSRQNQGLLLETPQHQQGPEHRQMSLAAELGVESPPDIVEIVANDEEQEREEPSKKKRKMGKSRNGGRVILERENEEPSTSVGVGTKKPPVGAGVKARQKSKTTSSNKAHAGVSRGGGSHGGVEKENGDVASRRTGTRSSSSTTTARTVGAKSTRTRTKVSVGASSKGGPSMSTAGPRRVPINSVEAPDIRRNS